MYERSILAVRIMLYCIFNERDKQERRKPYLIYITFFRYDIVEIIPAYLFQIQEIIHKMNIRIELYLFLRTVVKLVTQQVFQLE